MIKPSRLVTYLTTFMLAVPMACTTEIPFNSLALTTIDCSKTGFTIPANPTDSSCMFNIIAVKGLECWVECQAGGQNLKSSVGMSQAGEPVTVKVEGLSPQTTYAYKAKYNQEGSFSITEGSGGSFSTQKKPGDTFSFGVQGDSHPERERNMFNSDLYYLTMGNAMLANPDFYFMMGDDFSIDPLIEKNQVTDTNVDFIYKLQRKWVGNLGKPLFLVNGNHEQAAKVCLDGTDKSPAALAVKYSNMYYPKQFPDNFYTGDQEKVDNVGLLGDYYAFTWGDALFVVINHYWHSEIAVDNTPGKNPRTGDNLKNKDFWKITLGDSQYAWLKKILESSSSKYKFVFEHHALGTGRGGIERAKDFEWGGCNKRGINEFSKMRPSWELPLHDLFKKTGVTIFFQGHDHIFAHQVLDGIVYQTVPNPADNTYTAFNIESYKSGDILPNSGFLNVTVSPTGVKVDYIRSYLPKDESVDNKNGAIAFCYTVGKAGSQPMPQPALNQNASGNESIILGSPSIDSVTMNIIPQNDSLMTVSYGTIADKLDQRSKTITAKKNLPFELAITGLKPDTQYFYVVETKIGEKTSFGQQTSFQTAKSVGKSFVFDIQTDPHLDEQSDTATYKQTLGNILSDKPDFLIDLGDFSMTDKLDSKTETAIKDRYILNRNYLDSTCKSIPLLMALGNHDGEAGWDYKTNTNLFKWSRQYRYTYFPNPYPNSFYSGNTSKENDRYQADYYSFTWGDALFVVLNPYSYTDRKPGNNGWVWTLGKTQYDWLKGVLENSKVKFKFIFIHQLVGGDNQGRGGIEFTKFYEWGGHNADGTYGFDNYRPGWGEPLHRLFADNKVSAIFKGHDHLYAKQDLDGIVYQTLPQPSHAGEKIPSDVEYGYKSGKIIGGSGHLRVTVTPTKTTVEFVKANIRKEVVYLYEIK